MLSSLIIFAQASALMAGQVASVTAPVAAGRTLKDLPNTTIAYFDVQGTNASAIQKSLKKVLADPAMKANVQLYSWNVGAQITKRTQGQDCTIQSATATLTNDVHLPRLAEEAKIDKEIVASWRTFVAGLENEAAANLWFIRERLPAVEQSMAGLKCDQADTTWNAGIDKLKTELTAFGVQRATAAKNAAK